MGHSLQYVPIKKIAKLVRGSEPGSKVYSKSGEVRFIRISDLTGSKDEKIYVPNSDDLVIVNKKDILLSLDGTPGIVSKNLSGAISSGIRKIVPLKDVQVMKDYLYYMLHSRSVQEVIDKHSKGVTIKHASSAIKHIKIPLFSMEEQKKIVNKLEPIEQVLRTQQFLVNGTLNLRDIILNTNLNHDNTKKKGWKIKTLEEVCDIIYRYPTFYGFKYVEKGIPVLKISNFSKRETFDPNLSNYDYITEEINSRYPKTILKREDLVMGVRGTYIGKCVLVPSFLESANMSPNLIRISPNRNIINPRFLWNFTYSDWWNEQINKIVYYWKKKFGTIRASELKQVSIPVPNLEVQNNLLQLMDKSRNIIIENEIDVKKCKELRNIIINKFYENKF